MKKRPTSFRLSEEALRLLKVMADNLGRSQTSVMEDIIRKEAHIRNIAGTPRREDAVRPEG